MGLQDSYEKVKPAVVAIAIVEEDGSKVKFRIFGSGFCVDPNGLVVTARHVVTGYYEWLRAPLPKSHPVAMTHITQPSFRAVFFQRGSEGYIARWTPVMKFLLPFEGDEPEYDVAILRILKDPKLAYPYLQLDDLLTVREGREVAISGYPLRTDLVDSRLPDVSKGIISRVDQKIGEDKRWETTRLVLDITANPGNSGGPVFETNSGRVLGLVSEEKLQEPLEFSDTLRESIAELPAQFEKVFKNIIGELASLVQVPTGIIYCIPSSLISRALSAFKAAEKDTAPSSSALF